jgi:alkylation response protein AidB-like acyl-CoA dehydrogenase
VDFSLTFEQQQIRDTVRSFIEKEVVPLEPQVLRNEIAGRPGIERTELRELQLKAKALGFWGIETPEEYGGADLGPILMAILAIETGRTFVPFEFGGWADNILFACNAEQRDRYLLPTIAGERISCFAMTEPSSGSDARNIRTRAVKNGGDWVINGEKTFITSGHQADFTMVFATTGPADAPGGGVTCFLVDRDMGWMSSPIPTMGGEYPATLSFEDVRVPQENVLGEVGNGFGLAMEWIGIGRIIIPATAVGAAERMLDMAIEFAKTRVSMGHPISEYQGIQWQIADSQVEIESVKWLTLHAAWQAENDRDYRHSAAIAKFSGSGMANRVADRVMQIHGGMGYSRELPIERWYRELRVMRIYEGTDEILRRTIARNLIRGHVRLGQLGR